MWQQTHVASFDALKLVSRWGETEYYLINKERSRSRNRKLFWPTTVRKNCSSDQILFANSRPSALNFKSFSGSLEQFIWTVNDQLQFLKHIDFLTCSWRFLRSDRLEQFKFKLEKKLGFMINWNQKLKLKTKNQNIFFGVNENLTTFLYTIEGKRKQHKKKKFYFIKCITKSKCY